MPVQPHQPDRRTTLAARLRAAGCVWADDEADLLLAELADDPVALESATAARVAGAPLEHLLGFAVFEGVRARVAPGVFVPRTRSGLLVDLAVDLAPAGATVVDLCCGSGALLAASLHRRPDLDGWASDVDPVAVDCARRTLAEVAGLGADRVVAGDLDTGLPDHLRGGVDVLLVNAPYVPTGAVGAMPPEARDHEPRAALDGGTDGLDVHRRVAAVAPTWLRPGGVLLVEVAPVQVATLLGVLAAHGIRGRVEEDEERGATAVVGLRD
ncbi:MAG: putative protein N(5)-glutamine methyltransferase [Nocardioides sp.]|nr:putative protein N(5)-glutamine methyltransferase [Nocardioides sp.]